MAARLLEILAPLSAIASIAVVGILPDSASPPKPDWPALTALEHLALDGASDGDSLHWRDDTLGYEATLTADRPYLDPSGRVCRSILRVVQVQNEDEARSSRHHACRAEDGTWSTASAPPDETRSLSSLGRLFDGQTAQTAGIDG